MDPALEEGIMERQTWSNVPFVGSIKGIDNAGKVAGLGYVFSVWDSICARDWIAFDVGQRPDWNKVRDLFRTYEATSFEDGESGCKFSDIESYISFIDSKFS